MSEPLALVGLVALFWLLRKYRRGRAVNDPVADAFRARHLRELDAHLDRFAKTEVRRLDASVVRYVAGEAGHVVAVLEPPHGISLGLSDGRRLALGSVSQSTLTLLKHLVAHDNLRPQHVHRDGLSYRLLFRGEAGAEIEVGTRRLVLAP